ncbi:cyclic lactone autoinducer peptide [Schinkia azotoformans MEV2011]|uniref:Cyclic lactone autoinducer peptide n=1 Tax=Schinkia azotoformans MEV2011 TaxID=1348973 RepID=A0A072NHD5_SCHAZ|nr:cyclic lactone autoinducer peptide [Schinkia azotoformans]KEF36627.1 cyclic lactone autoinducer peptide [Schinkia azotoformans MEV2011]MEC1695592.1 cyclic lactone autoinducer peptide [Schinkia azotoformans]MEC1740761.1 cyclic lactone autoinducer peptide [Schinkia azotoformans]MEC1770895.1 cyclic lactone autoinducer peptide [Schinkia azotoformans]MEC1786831.1 cyclic lactone autoinducer peptide [Schinkia azotoformans]
MKKTSSIVIKVFCNLLLTAAPILVTTTQSFVFWDEVEIPNSLK